MGQDKVKVSLSREKKFLKQVLNFWGLVLEKQTKNTFGIKQSDTDSSTEVSALTQDNAF